MKMSGAIAMSVACALAGFFGGRLSQDPASAKKGNDETAERSGGRAGGTDDSGRNTSGKLGSSKSGSRSSNGAKGGTLSETLREIVGAWNNQDVTMPDGSETELLLFDLAKFGKIMSSLDKTSEADIAEIRDLIRTDEDSSEEAEVLKTLVTLPLIGRDIELRGARALDDEIDRALEDPIESDAEEILPIMIYSLAVQDPAQAEAWLENYSKREDVDELLVDTEELQAAIDKAKGAASE